MALTYYIRSWDPRSTYPTNPQEGDICYTITLDQTWAPVGGVKKENIVKEEIYQNGAWVEQGGGGGGGLNSTTMTVNLAVNSLLSESSIAFYSLLVDDDGIVNTYELLQGGMPAGVIIDPKMALSVTETFEDVIVSQAFYVNSEKTVTVSNLVNCSYNDGIITVIGENPSFTVTLS